MLKHWKSLALGFGGALLALGIWHAYNDHMALHQMIGIVNNAVAAQAQAAQAPQTGLVK